MAAIRKQSVPLATVYGDGSSFRGPGMGAGGGGEIINNSVLSTTTQDFAFADRPNRHQSIKYTTTSNNNSIGMKKATRNINIERINPIASTTNDEALPVVRNVAAAASNNPRQTLYNSPYNQYQAKQGSTVGGGGVNNIQFVSHSKRSSNGSPRRSP